MISMYDQPVVIPIRDMLDNSTMQMYLSAAREEYNRAYTEQKEFAKEFGDLMSSNNALNNAYYNETKGAVYDVMNRMQQAGIDPIRSAEGRAMIAQTIRNRPYAKIAGWKQDAENLKTYDKAKAQMIMNGTWNPEYEQWALEQNGLANWDPYSDQRWDRLSPVKYTDNGTLTQPYAKQLQEELLTDDQLKRMGVTPDKYRMYWGYSMDAVGEAGSRAANALSKTDQGKFEMDQIRKEMIASGVTPTDKDVFNAYADKLTRSFEKQPGITKNEWDKKAFEDLDFAQQKQLAAIQHRYAKDLEAVKNSYATDLAEAKAQYKSTGGNNKTSNWFMRMYQQPGVVVERSDLEDMRKNGITLDDPMINVRETNKKILIGKDKQKTTNRIERKITVPKDILSTFENVAYGDFVKAKRENRSKLYRAHIDDTSSDLTMKSLRKYSYDDNSDKFYELFETTGGKKMWVPVHYGYIDEDKVKANTEYDLYDD